MATYMNSVMICVEYNVQYIFDVLKRTALHIINKNMYIYFKILRLSSNKCL